MDTRVVILFLLAILPSAFAQTNAPLLLGDGKSAIATETIEHIAQVARSVGGEGAGLWMLHCDAYKSGPDVGHVFRVHVYFPPRVSTGRLLRGVGILCADSTMPQYWDTRSPRFGGWYSCDKIPTEYALVAPPGLTFGTNRPTEKPFVIFGTLSDSDVLAIIDAVRPSTKNERIKNMQVKDVTHICVSTAKGNGSEGWWIDFERIGMTWTETRRMKWRE